MLSVADSDQQRSGGAAVAQRPVKRMQISPLLCHNAWRRSSRNANRTPPSGCTVRHPQQLRPRACKCPPSRRNRLVVDLSQSLPDARKCHVAALRNSAI